jgi:hypothetical protein
MVLLPETVALHCRCILRSLFPLAAGSCPVIGRPRPFSGLDQLTSMVEAYARCRLLPAVPCSYAPTAEILILPLAGDIPVPLEHWKTGPTSRGRYNQPNGVANMDVERAGNLCFPTLAGGNG